MILFNHIIDHRLLIILPVVIGVLGGTAPDLGSFIEFLCAYIDAFLQVPTKILLLCVCTGNIGNSVFVYKSVTSI